MKEYSNISDAILRAEKVLSGFELEFFKRIWSSPLDKYHARLKAIGFENKERVLDAGFGNAQWTICLANLNKTVDGIEYTNTRVKVGEILKEELKLNNTTLIQGSTQELPYESNSFDAIFCYGVIFLTDYRKTMAEFYRVLKPGGCLYFTANGLGWYQMCLVTEHNKSEAYDPRQMASETLEHSFDYFALNKNFIPGKQLAVNRELLENLLSKAGFSKWTIASEGAITITDKTPESFYKYTKYLSSDFIYEALCYK